MPCASPVLVKRRLTPAKLASAWRMVSSGRPISCATVIAASAFCTLCWPNIGTGADAIGQDAAVGDARDQGLHLGMVRAQDREAIEGDVLDEAHEGVAHRIEGAVMVEVLGIDIGDDGN